MSTMTPETKYDLYYKILIFNAGSIMLNYYHSVLRLCRFTMGDGSSYLLIIRARKGHKEF